MAKNSVTQVSGTIRSSHIRRRWQREFLQRIHQEPLSDWRCIGVDIGKYEHVAVATAKPSLSTFSRLQTFAIPIV